VIFEAFTKEKGSKPMVHIKQGKNELLNVPIKIIFQMNVIFSLENCLLKKCFKYFFPLVFPYKESFSNRRYGSHEVKQCGQKLSQGKLLKKLVFLV